jgi:hypothetical protein
MCNKNGASLLRIPTASVFARAGNDRLEELVHSEYLSEFMKLQIHVDGFISVADLIFSNQDNFWHAFLTPIHKILSSSTSYLELAKQHDAHHKALYILNRLKVL